MKKKQLNSIDTLISGHNVALMYRTEVKHKAALMPFLRQGLVTGEKILYISDSHAADVIIDGLRDEGTEIERFLANGQVSITNSDDAYMKIVNIIGFSLPPDSVKYTGLHV